MNVAVIGGTGVLGRLVVAELAARGDTVRVVTRNAPVGATAALAGGVGAGGADAATGGPPGGADAAAGGPRDAIEHRRADVRSGEGLAAALDGVEAVVNAVNDPRGGRETLVVGTRRLLAAEAAAGIGHHVEISIVGCDRVPLGYYEAKVAQEGAVAGGPVPWSVLRATQFHPLVAQLFAAAGRRRLQPRGGILVQPIDPAAVAVRLAEAVHAGPSGRLPDVGGPEVRTLSQLAADWRAHGGAARAAIPLPLPPVGKLLRALHDGALCDRDAAVPGATFASWLTRNRPDVMGADVRESVAR